MQQNRDHRIAPAVRARKAIVERLAAPLGDKVNEAQTRVDLIDFVLRELGWDRGTFTVEDPDGAGGYLDYLLKSLDGAWMVVEAKRVDRPFEIIASGRAAAKTTQPLSAFVRLGAEPLEKVVEQAARYCARRGAPFACVTNGLQWLFFRGLSRPQRPYLKESAIIFDGIDDITDRFADFSNILARAEAGKPWLGELLDRPAPLPTRGVRPIEKLAGLSLRKPAGKRSNADMVHDLLGKRYLGRLHTTEAGLDRRQLLGRCYVESHIDGHLEKTVRQLVRAQAEATRPSAADEAQAPRQFADRLIRDHADENTSEEPILVVGDVGAGKTTYIYRALDELRQDDKEAFFAVVDLEEAHASCEGQEDYAAVVARHIAERVMQQLGHTAKSSLTPKQRRTGERFQVEPDAVEVFRTRCRDDLRKRRRNLKVVLGDKLEDVWRVEEQKLYDAWLANPIERCFSFVTHLASHFKVRRGGEERPRPVVVVLDNVDVEPDPFQRAAYIFAKRLARTRHGVALMCMRRSTYDRGKRSDGFLTGAELTHVVHVVPPPLDVVLDRRLKHARWHLQTKQLPTGLRNKPSELIEEAIENACKLYVGRGQDSAASTLQGLAGTNMREALSMARDVLAMVPSMTRPISPSADYLFEAMLRVPKPKGVGALTANLYNCFEPVVAGSPVHWLPFRILGALDWRHHSSTAPGRWDVENLLGQLTAWGYPLMTAREALHRLADQGLLQIAGEMVQLTASGYKHLHAGLADANYRLAAALHTPWHDETCLESFLERARGAGGDTLTFGDLAVAEVVDEFDIYLSQQLAAEDAMLVENFRPAWRERAVALASLAPVRQSGSRVRQSSSYGDGDKRTTHVVAPDQLRLIGENTRGEVEAALMAVGPPPNPSWRGQKGVYFPRILWTLALAQHLGRGPMTAADIAKLFSAHGPVKVLPNNVARAFRRLKSDREACLCWRMSGTKRYAIVEHGRRVLKALNSKAKWR